MSIRNDPVTEARRAARVDTTTRLAPRLRLVRHSLRRWRKQPRPAPLCMQAASEAVILHAHGIARANVSSFIGDLTRHEDPGLSSRVCRLRGLRKLTPPVPPERLPDVVKEAVSPFQADGKGLIGQAS